jgi:hypothetical protein
VSEPLRVERQQVLEAQDRIGEDDPDQAECQEGNRVPLPILLRLRVDPQKAVEEPLDGLERGVEERRPIRVQDPVEIDAHRLGDEQEYAQENSELNPAETIHGTTSYLEFLGFDDRHEKIRDQYNADDSDKNVQHGFRSFPGTWRTGGTIRTPG